MLSRSEAFEELLAGKEIKSTRWIDKEVTVKLIPDGNCSKVLRYLDNGVPNEDTALMHAIFINDDKVYCVVDRPVTITKSDFFNARDNHAGKYSSANEFWNAFADELFKN